MPDLENPPDIRTLWIQRGFVAAVVLACGIALSTNDPNTDLWGHIRYAQDAFEDGQLHQTSTHNYTAEGYRWINHENLAEVALATGYQFLGARGLVIVNALLGFAVLGLMMFTSFRNGVSLVVTCCFLLATAITLAAFWSIRPQVLSFVMLTMMVVILERAFAGWMNGEKVRVGWLWLLPPLFAVWTNTHGAFVAGVCLASAYLGIRGIELLFLRERDERTVKTILHLVAVGLACWIFTLFNPYGTELHLWLFDSLGNPRPEITEWAAPSIHDDFFIPFVALSVLTIAAFLGTTKRRDLAQVALLVLCLWQSVSHVRHIALFAILAGFWAPPHLESLLARLGRKPKRNGGDSMNKAAFGIVGGALVCVFVLLFSKLYMTLSDLPVRRNDYPVSAMQFIADNDLDGRLVVAFNWAQYSLAALAPDVKVQFDGRFRTCYPQDVIDMHFDFLVGTAPDARSRSDESGPFDPTRVLRHLDPNLVLVDRRFQHSANVMETQQEDFVLLYQDSIAQVWGRATLYDDPNSALFVAPNRRTVGNEPQQGSVTFPAFPNSSTVVRRTR